MRMIDEDEVGLKEKPEELDTSQILHRNKTRCSTDSVGKGLDSYICHYRNCKLGNGQGHYSLDGPGRGEIHTQVHRLSQNYWLYGVPSPRKWHAKTASCAVAC